MPFDVGLPELIIIFVIVLLLFGAGRLPQLGNAVGRSIREFKRGMAGEDDQKPAAEAPAAQTQAAASPSGQGQGAVTGPNTVSQPAQPGPKPAPTKES